MTYAYEFELPGARGPVQPTLALTYSSASHDREAGYGWGLDLPVIERAPISGNARLSVEMTPGRGDERFTFNGQPLIFVCQIGGNCPSGETHPDWASWSYYRLQSDDMFARFYRSPTDGLEWRVQLKGGTRLELGGAGAVESIGTKAVRWRLRRHVDAVHPENVVEYRWAALGSRGLLYLTDIFDTKRASGHASDADFAHHTQLVWEAPGFDQTSYADPLHATPDRRLARVGVTSKSWLATTAREVVRVYHLEYLENRGLSSYTAGVTAPLWHHSSLHRIRIDGKCGHLEDGSGNVPENTPCNASLPPTTFAYEGGAVGFATSSLSTVEGGATDLVQNRRVFNDEEVISILDFDRDGIPDLVQPWESGPWCWDGQGSTSVSANGQELVCHHDGHDHPLSAPATAHVGYLNRGKNIGGGSLRLVHQCIDAAIPAGLNAGLPASFLTAQAGATVGGAWSTGLVMWVPDVIPNFNQGPFLARPTGRPSAGCDLANFDPNTFSAAWRWKALPLDFDWATNAGPRPTHVGTNWFTDVDGDGLVDEIVESNQAPIGDFRPASIKFTRRFAANEPNGSWRPIQKPFDESNFSANSLAPREGVSNTKYFYVDANGDGLVDLVTATNGGNYLRVRPGDGRGNFECVSAKNPSGIPCETFLDEPKQFYQFYIPGSEVPFPFTNDTSIHDVTGDGLADIVKYDPATGAVRVWVNRDGHEIGCAATGCIAGYVWDDVHMTADLGPHKLAFADMDADGVDDVVLLARGGVFFASIIQRSNSVVEHAPRPGQLVRIDNGRGATTRIRYRTIQELDLEAQAAGEPWVHHSRAVESVVTQIWTQDTSTVNGTPLSHPYDFFRTVEYSYRDPAYDRWTRAFRGFRKVRARVGGETAVTESTYWFSACQNDRHSVEPPPKEHPEDPDPQPEVPELLCGDTTELDPLQGVSGRLVRVDRFIPAIAGPQGGPAKHLWTKTYGWSDAAWSIYIEPSTGRSASSMFVSSEDTYLFDDALSVSVPPPPEPNPSGNDSLAEVPTQPGRKHTRISRQLDWHGNLVYFEDVGLADEAPDTQTVTLLSMTEPFAVTDWGAPLDCTADWQCNPTYVTTFGWFAGGSQQSTPVGDHTRKLHFQYALPGNAGDVNQVDGWLDGSIPLDRHHEPNVTPPPAVAPSLVSHATGWRTLATFAHDAFGNVTNISRGPPTAPMCTVLGYDAPYAQFVSGANYGTSNCTTYGVRRTYVYDRGFGIATGMSSLAVGQYLLGLDAFGRVTGVASPQPDTGDPAAVTLAASITYTDQSPISTVDVTRYLSATETVRSVTAVNGIGEPVLRFDQEGGANWIVSGWTETNNAGQVQSVRRPEKWSGDPLTYVLGGYPPLGVLDRVDAYYDGFGRLYSAVDFSSVPNVELFHHEFHPLSVVSQDAEQLRTGSPFAASFSTQVFDGHGRVTSTVHHSTTTFFDPQTSVDYYPTGEPRTIARGPVSGYGRTLSFDTLGRLVMNVEPNTGTTHYAWDEANRLVGTSDARGCGVNLHYDGLGRVRFEDYSPCLSTHAEYTEGNPSTGEGFEASYRYDTYESGQMSSDATFVENQRFASEQLTAVLDRGGHTRFNYDNRGRARRISRQAAKPASSPSLDRIAPHWFASRTDLDLGDRLTRRTTGAEGNLLVGGTSEEYYVYNARGLLDRILTSYGQILRYVDYDADGAVNLARYGDAAATEVTFARDARRRLIEHKVSRSPTDVWTTPSATYTLPGADTTPTVPLDLHFLSIDAVGNPGVIQDQASLSVPETHAPIAQRTIGYDDMYRVSSVAYSYATPTGGAAWQSPYAPEVSAGDRRPIPLRAATSRVQNQSFSFDDVGNTTAVTDDSNGFFDRSLGASVTNGGAGIGPNQLRAAQGMSADYDAAGNLTQLRVDRGAASCPDGTGSHCAQWFAYDWDEIGQLVHARRWDFVDGLPTLPAGQDLPSTTPTWEMSYAYSMGVRILKTSKDALGAEEHTLDVLPTLRVLGTTFDEPSGDYDRNESRVRASLAGGAAEVVYDGSLPQPNPAAPPWHLFLILGDQLGSAAIVLDHASSELVERTTYQAYGTLESDLRPDRWGNFRADHKFTGKEEDIEVGLTYFGARYYAAHLGRWASADPLTIHGLGGDLNPYAYVSGRVASHVDPFGLCTPGSQTRDPNGTTTTVEGCPDEKRRSGIDPGARGAAGPWLDPFGRNTGRFVDQNVARVLQEQNLANKVQAGAPPTRRRPGTGTGRASGSTQTMLWGLWNGFLHEGFSPVLQPILHGIEAPETGDDNYDVGNALMIVVAMVGPQVAEKLGVALLEGVGAGLGRAVHGNSLLSTRAQHVYEILQTDAAGNTEVFKWGVSGGPLNAAGLSVRAEAQVSALNRAAGGMFTYESSVVQIFPAGPGARPAALSLERNLVYDYRTLTGAKPIGNIRP